MKKYFFILTVILFKISCSPIHVSDEIENNLLYNKSFPQRILFLGLNDKIIYKAFPLDRNSQVNYWIRYYSKGKGQTTMKINLQKLGRYKDYMGNILNKEGLPTELIYLAMVESSFNPSIRSSADAVGYWQFIPSTAQSYQLRINSTIDERKDFALSTKAVTKYLKHLYSRFQDWYLSLAAYNCGESCVQKAIRKYRIRDFWLLSEKSALPKETRNHVPKIIAMAHISKNPRAYGFSNLALFSPLDYNLLQVGQSTRLSEIAKYLNIPLSKLKLLNSKYETDYVPHSYEIRIPTNVSL
ncbi:MAG: lytic transglycosylase domain-containing protein [Bdellovibrionales bacterium]|nr:lytic transglycosylase domain-containing protein [Bdellovibrionales bacterium]